MGALETQPPQQPKTTSQAAAQQQLTMFAHSQAARRKSPSKMDGNPMVEPRSSVSPARTPRIKEEEDEVELRTMLQNEIRGGNYRENDNTEDSPIFIISDDDSDIQGSNSERESLQADGEVVKQPKTRKYGPRARTAREAHQNAFNRRIALERNRKPKSPGSRASKRKRTDSRGRASKNKVQKSERRRRSKTNNSDDNDLLRNLTHYDPVAAYEAQPDQGPAPKITANLKKDLFQELEKHWKDADTSFDLHKTAGVNLRTLDKISRRFGYLNMRPANEKWMLKGMDTAFYNHQIIGVDFMLGREFNFAKDGPCGGILADVMGLGKTIEVIGCMVANPPGHSEEQKAQLGDNVLDGRNTTLIVVPNQNLATQWKDGIDKHAKTTFPKKAFLYKRSQIKDLEDNVDPLASPIVITTYHEIMASCPWPDKKTFEVLRDEARLVQEPFSMEHWIASQTESFGFLHQVHWYRIVLDEGHCIKNYATRSSHACNALNGDLRWVLGGTPVMNSLHEFYSHFRFLKDPSPAASSMNSFSNEIIETKDGYFPSPILSSMLGHAMIRRTIQDKLFGRPLLDLPRPHRDFTEVRLSAVESVLYRAIEQKFRELLNEYFADAKDADKQNYTYLLPQLTRLRQAIAHTCLLESTVKSVFEVAEFKTLQNILYKVYKKKPSAGLVLHDQINTWIKEKVIEDKERQEILTWKTKPCGQCRDDPEEYSPTQIIGCGHVFCLPCIEAVVDVQIRIGREISCPADDCGRVFDPGHHLKPFVSPIRASKGKKGRESSGPSKVKGKDTLGVKPDTSMTPSKWLERHDEGKIGFLDSAKLMMVKDIIQAYLRDAASEKTIVFVQWRLLGVLIGRYLQDSSVSFVYYTGDMTATQRNKAIQEFRTQDQVRVMVAGLKCGGVGLNLTCASRVICVDLWWNTCIEQQAFSRVYRIGQEKEARFMRIVALNTVDDRIVKLQKSKNEFIGTAMQDNLTNEEMASLFGHITKDQAGVIQVMPDYDGEDELDNLQLELNDDERRFIPRM